MSTFDLTGLSVSSFDDLKTEYENLFKQEFGENIDLDVDSVFGHIVNVLALAAAEQNELAEYVADSFDIQAASGAALSSLALLAGVERQESLYSTVSLTCTANAAGCTIPAGSLVSDPSSAYQWETDSQLVIAPSATDSVSATCTEAGAIEAAADTLTQIDTPVYGWSAVTNPAAASTGQTEETDSALRARYQIAAERASGCSTSAIHQAVTNVSGVADCLVMENTSGSTDAYGVPTGCVWVVVRGGADADIAEAIGEHLAAGVGTYGNTSETYAPIAAAAQTIYFERPSDVEFYLLANLTTDGNYPADGDDDVSDAIVAYAGENQTLGVDVMWSRYFTPCNEVGGHRVLSLYIGTSDPPSGTTDITINPNQRAVITSARITVNS